jgi:hypothetical protein
LGIVRHRWWWYGSFIRSATALHMLGLLMVLLVLLFASKVLGMQALALTLG